MRIAITLLCIQFLLAGCGGGGSGSSGVVPGAPTGITVNAGDTAVSIGWNAPLVSGDSAITQYNVRVYPAVAVGNIHISGTRALIAGLSNGTDYAISVAAVNSAGSGPDSVAVTARPGAADNSTYNVMTINSDPGSPNGVYDPSLVRGTTDDLWLSYSSVHFYTDSSSHVVQDVGTRVARSSDNGVSFDWVATVATPTNTTVTDTDPAHSACGTATCNGRWVYETSSLVEDPGDPDPNRRFKLFAHQYFVYPQSGASKTLYQLGAIVMWTASSPDATWSSKSVLFRWPLTPPELTGGTDITTLSGDLASCILAAEPGASVSGDTLQFVFACPYVDASTSKVVQKIVLLQSTDHATSFQYAGTLLTPADAAGTGIDYFSAPALIASGDNAPLLLVTPVVSGQYAGSMVFPFAAGNTLFRYSGTAQAISYVPVQAAGHIGGASTYATNTGSLGVVQSDAIPGSPLTNTQFRIIATHSMPQQ